jgi:hypothetical protein
VKIGAKQVALVALVLAALLALAPAAGAKPQLHLVAPPARVTVGRVALSTPTTGAGGAALLAPVHYPVIFSGRLATLKVALTRPGGGVVKSWTLHERVGAGLLRTADRRRSFTFVHRVGLKPAEAEEVRAGSLLVQVTAGGAVDVNGDGVPELRSSARSAPLAALTGPGGGRLCSSEPRISVAPGGRISIPLPVCSASVRWQIGVGPSRGSARIRGDRLVYRAPRRQRGLDSLVLRGVGRGTGVSGSRAGGDGAELADPVQVTVGPASGLVVRAIGDSVTAGFGYYGDGESMGILELPFCKPAKPFNDACSSNSEVSSNSSKVIAYADDYGRFNNISWAAQWANEYGITNYENLAISGSEPDEWAPGGSLHPTLEEVEGENPDYILMTMGANPLLSEMLFGVDHMGCAIYSDIFGDFRKCAERSFAAVELHQNLTALYRDLVDHTQATIYLMQYHLAIPSSALAYTSVQVAEFAKLVNEEIATVAAEVDSPRLQVIAPPHFNVGVDLSPVYPSNYLCPGGDEAVDGPSDQSTPTQDELDFLHPLSFCPGPVPKGPPWVISGDTGIHPSATGYTQMASRLPAPTESK